MPTTITFSGAAFAIDTAVQGSDGQTIIVSFTQAALSLNPAGPTDALNPGNYSLAGPSYTSVQSVTKISGAVFYLHLSAPLQTGFYTLTINPALQSATLATLTGSNVVVIATTASNALEPLNAGAANWDAANIIRNFLPPIYRYRTAWEALIAALAAGDGLIKQNVYLAFDQLFMSTAVGRYLLRKAADWGIIQPPNLGMSDDLFRKLVIRITAHKLTAEALLEVLNVFYGDNATRAHIITTNSGPFALQDGDAISFLLDDREAVTITFRAGDFANIGNASTAEVVTVITRAFQHAGLRAFAAETSDGRIAVFSGALGLVGSVACTGGMASNVLQFPILIPLWSTFPGPAPQWIGRRISQDEFRFLWNRSYFPGNLDQLPIGFLVMANIDLVNVPNLRGSYEVTDIHIDADQITGSYMGYSWFTIKPGPNFPYALGATVTITQVNTSEIIFLDAADETVIDLQGAAYIAQHLDTNGTDVILPATTQAVNRTVDSGAYLHVATPILIGTLPASVSRNSSGVVTVNTPVPHGLSPGQVVILDGVIGETAGRWQVSGRIATVPLPTRLTFQTEDTAAGTGHGGTMTPVTAPSAGDIPGPYAFDPDGGVAVTGIHSTTTASIAGLRGLTYLPVVSTLTFPNSEGWLVIGFGTSFQTGPIKYLGVLNSTNLILDRSFTFPVPIPSGADVTLLAQNSPFVPADPTKVGSFYLTDSVAGRVAAQSFIEDISAAGNTINPLIQYPGDRGIGGQGNPITGPVLSDKVAVWAGDNVDQEVAAAHNA